MLPFRLRFTQSVLLLLVLIGIPADFFSQRFFSEVSAADWPMWRHDAARSGASPAVLPRELHLQWVLRLPKPLPAWPESQPKLDFDRHYEPVAAGRRLLIGSTVSETVAAFDTRTGTRQWVFFTDGPVRFAPAISGERVYVTSDDGYLYCLSLETGKQIWRVLGGPGGPSSPLIIGNGRLISMWPARGGVVVKDGMAYFAAGIWPSMGIFIRAVDAETGKVLWTNSTTGSRWVRHPHGADAFGSISPQGYLAISGDNLIVPGGRTLPGVFDLKTGELRHFEFGGRGTGGPAAIASGELMHVGGEAFRISDGRSFGKMPASFVGRGIAGLDGSKLVVNSLEGIVTEVTVKDRKGKEVRKFTWTPKRKEIFPLDGPSHRVFIEAGSRVFASELGRIAAYGYGEFPGTLKPDWQISTDPPASSESYSEAVSMIAADDRLFVVMDDHRVLCYGAEKPKERPPELSWQEGPDDGGSRIEHVPFAIEDYPAGYAVSLCPPSQDTLHRLMHKTRLKLISYERPRNVNFAPFDPWVWSHDWYGDRMTYRSGMFFWRKQPPYFASLIFCDVKREYPLPYIGVMFDMLRPYGGECRLVTSQATHNSIEYAITKKGSIFSLGDKFQSATITRDGEWTIIRRNGPLPDAGVWTHQYGDSSNSVVSADDLVKAPLGLLWFGGPSNDRVLPRHGHGPSPQVSGGRLFIEGADMLRCVDVYTGRVWWERDLPGLGTYYNNTGHHPGAGEIGSNYVSLPDRVYVIHKEKLLALDAATGETKHEFTHATIPGESVRENQWGAVLAEGDLLVTAASPVTIETEGTDETKVEGSGKKPSLSDVLLPTQYASASRFLSVFNRHTGEALWGRDAEFSFRHNAICVVEDRLFCIDAFSPAKLAALKRRGVEPKGKPKLLCLNAKTGKEIWSTDEDVFGTFLSYSREHDLLVQAGSAYRDRAKDEVDKGLVVYDGRSGEVLWKNLELKYGGPLLIHHDRLITNGGGGFEIDLKTGERSGWTYSRMYGCNTAVGSEHLLTFRSGAAGFCDLSGDSGTGNLGGFRSSCTANLIAADGVLNAPDYTRTCGCAYQLQTSLALIHMPEAEAWTFGNQRLFNEPVQSVGINLGAPGDRRDESGTLWFDYPSVGGPGPKLSVETEPKSPKTFAQHSALLADDPLNWVGASGVIGIRKLRLSAKLPRETKTVTVRLVFAEPAGTGSRSRSFSVKLSGQAVEENFNLSQAAAAGRTIVREFRAIPFDGTLEVELTPHGDSAETVLSGVAIAAESVE